MRRKSDELILKNRLKVARAEKSLTQGELADLVGVSRQTISSMKQGSLIRPPNLHLFYV